MRTAGLRRELWRHRPSGQFWAIELDDQQVLGAAGPLGRTEPDPVLLDHLPCDGRYVRWIKEHCADFTPVDPRMAASPRKAPAKVYPPAPAEERRIG